MSVIGGKARGLESIRRSWRVGAHRGDVFTRTRGLPLLAGLEHDGYGEAVSKSGSRFKPPDEEPFTLTDVAAEDAGDGSSHWCFKVQGLDNTVQAARFATRREADKAHGRLKRALELLGQQIPG
jgi:hypothetical protein